MANAHDILPPHPPAPPGGVELAPGVRAPESALRWQFARGGGPGGQNVNKVNTKAELWLPIPAITGMKERALSRLRLQAARYVTDRDELHISSDTHRTQIANRQTVMDRLRDLLVTARHEPKVRRKTKPTKASRQRRLQSKRHRGEIKAGRRSHGEG